MTNGAWSCYLLVKSKTLAGRTYSGTTCGKVNASEGMRCLWKERNGGPDVSGAKFGASIVPVVGGVNLRNGRPIGGASEELVDDFTDETLKTAAVSGKARFDDGQE